MARLFCMVGGFIFSIDFFQSVIVLILSTLQSYFRLAFLNCLAYIVDYQYIFTIFCFLYI